MINKCEGSREIKVRELKRTWRKNKKRLWERRASGRKKWVGDEKNLWKRGRKYNHCFIVWEKWKGKLNRKGIKEEEGENRNTK